MRKTIPSIAVAALLLGGLLSAGCQRTRRSPLPADTEQDTAQPVTALKRDRDVEVVFVEFVATPHDVVARMLKMADVQSDDVVYDLGCGDGRILIAAAEKYGCRAVGFDLDPLRVAEARAAAEQHAVADRVTVELKDVLAVDLRPATVVTLYLGTELNRDLVPQLQQLPAGARIVSHNFGIEGFPADKVIRMTSREDHEEHLIHLWTAPLKPAEDW